LLSHCQMRVEASFWQNLSCLPALRFAK